MRSLLLLNSSDFWQVPDYSMMAHWQAETLKHEAFHRIVLPTAAELNGPNVSGGVNTSSEQTQHDQQPASTVQDKREMAEPHRRHAKVY